MTTQPITWATAGITAGVIHFLTHPTGLVSLALGAFSLACMIQAARTYKRAQ